MFIMANIGINSEYSTHLDLDQSIMSKLIITLEENNFFIINIFFSLMNNFITIT
jgi:hypothetical protein